jgi:anti-sigma regulatory factor (Ser/Thr protein kinase)
MRAYDEVLLGRPTRPALGDVVTAHLELPAVPESAGTARRFVAFLIASWRLGVSADDAELVTSELVTNAITAVRKHGTPNGLVVVALAALASGAVRIDVWDPVATDALSAKAAEAGDENGRGLFLVDVLSDRWGQVDAVVGTQIWAQLSARAAA